MTRLLEHEDRSVHHISLMTTSSLMYKIVRRSSTPEISHAQAQLKTMEPRTLGNQRLERDVRQVGGMLMLTGICALFQPLVNIASLVGPAGSTETEGIAFSSLMGALCLATIGVASIFVGYLQVVHDTGHKLVTGALIIFTQSAFIPYITGIVNVSKISRTGAGFFPPEFEASADDVKFVGSMGILGIISYGFTFVGAIAFMQFTLYAFQAGKPDARPGSYYRGRLVFYSIMLFLAGFSQLMLGSRILDEYGDGPLEQGTVAVSVYRVNYPEITIFMGYHQVLNSLWGFARAFRLGILGPRDVSFQGSMFFSWLLQFGLQIMTQISYSPGSLHAGAAPQITAMSIGLNLMPAYLDWMARASPESIQDDYYEKEK